MRLGRVVILALATLVPPLALGGVTVAVRVRATGQRLDAAALAPGVTLPPARPPSAGRRLAVVVAGNHGTEITDALPIVELLTVSGAFEVRVVAPERRPSPFATSLLQAAGLDFVPDLGFEDYARVVGRAPDLLVVPYLPRWRAEDAAVLPWIAAHAGPATTVLSICQGAELVAAAGLFDGHAATANASMLDILAARHPRVRWQRGVRWVEDGRRISSSLLAGGLDATLVAVEALAGPDAAVRATVATGHARHERPLAAAAAIPAGVVLELAYRWERARVAVEIGDGVSEAAVAGLIDAHASTYASATVATVAGDARVVRSRSGLALLPRRMETGTRTVVAGAGRPGAYGYDQAIEAVARHHGGPAARMAASLLNYPIPGLALPAGLPPGVTVALRPILLGLAILVASLFVTARPGLPHRADARDADVPVDGAREGHP